MKMEDVTGRKFGRWTVVGRQKVGRINKCECVCECGNKKLIALHSLKNGDSSSCGCFNREALAARSTHRMTGTPTYNSWASMVARCTRPKSDPYGIYLAKGITVCDRWKQSFANFLADMGERPSKMHSLDRIDSTGNYEPANCRWATREEQAQNRKSCKKYTYNGKTMTIAEWAREAHMRQWVLWDRLANGVSFHDAITIPVEKYRGKKLPRA